MPTCPTPNNGTSCLTFSNLIQFRSEVVKLRNVFLRSFFFLACSLNGLSVFVVLVLYFSDFYSSALNIGQKTSYFHLNHSQYRPLSSKYLCFVLKSGILPVSSDMKFFSNEFFNFQNSRPIKIYF